MTNTEEAAEGVAGESSKPTDESLADSACATPTKSNRGGSRIIGVDSSSSSNPALATPETHKPDTREPPRLAASRASIQRLRRRFRRNDSNSTPLSADGSEREHRRLKNRLIQDHYRLDPDRRVVLPGVPRYEADWARDAHDFFNLIFLVPIIATNICGCWDWDKILLRRGSHHSPHGANNLNELLSWQDWIDSIKEYWTGEWFDWLLYLTMIYFIIDFIWVGLVPHCVKSPATILQHHLATMMYIYVPFQVNECRWIMGACLSVEINTWFLIARRVLNKQGFPPWTIDLSIVSIRVKLISICFYVTWIAIRCILYPALFFPILKRWTKQTEKVGSKWNLVLLSIPLHATFCLLNLKWTYDLLMSKVRYWRRKTRNQPHHHHHHSKGL